MGCSVLLDLGAALEYLHEEKRVAHLDVKPENILLSGDQHAKLCDFDTVLPFDTEVPHRPSFFLPL